MKKRMIDLENQIALQNANLNKISSNSNQKEEQLNNDITDYINQINELKNEMEVLNNIITNLTEEKENNAIKISSLLHENEKLKQNIKNNANNINNLSSKEKENSKKYEEIILKLKKNMLNLKEENKSLEEVILKQESEVSQLSSKVIEAEKVLIQKDKELQESIEYSAKLTSSINFHKNEIMKIKQKQSQTEVNKLDKNSEIIANLQKELQNMKKNLEMKENKLNVLSGNNKSLQEKLNKLTQIIKNELNININSKETIQNKVNSNTNTKYINKNKCNIHSSYNNYYTNKASISKPQSQLKNKTTRVSVPINSKSSNNLPKNNNINNNIENFKQNFKNLGNDKNTQYKRQNIEDKKLYIVSKHKIKSKTPGKVMKPQDPDAIIKNKHPGNNMNLNIKKIYNEYKPGIQISKSNINEKYKQIESKYSNEKREISKEDTLFNEDDINNLNINKEIISPFTKVEEDIEPIQIINNMNSETLKPKKEGRNNGINLLKKNLMEPQLSLASQEKEFPIIESYCLLMEKDKEKDINNNKDKDKSEVNPCLTSNSNNIGSGNESKLEAKQVEDLKNCVNKILNEF